MLCYSAWGCSNNSNTFTLYGFTFDRKRFETWEGNVNREGWKAKPGIMKLCGVGGDIIILRSRSGVGVEPIISTTSSNIVIRNFSCKQTRHMFPYDA